jgi:hypothetical protein
MKIVGVVIEGHLVGRGFVGRFIGRFTWGLYKHISGYFIFEDGSKRGFQSNSKHGCHFFDVDEERGNIHEFDVYATAEEFEAMYERALDIEGCGYDFGGIWGFVRRAKRENPNKFFCSEAWADILDCGDVTLLNLDFFKISPVLFCASTVIKRRY